MSCVGAEVVVNSRKFVGTDHEVVEQHTGTVEDHRFVEPLPRVFLYRIRDILKGEGPTYNGHDRIRVVVNPGHWIDTSFEGVRRIDGQPLESLAPDQGQSRG